MKVHIVGKGEDHIEGYSRVQVEGSLDMKDYSSNECSFILASDFADMFSHREINENIALLRSKMRIGSTLVVGGTDLRLLSRAVIDGSIDSETLNNILYTKRSVSSLNETVDIVSSLGLLVLTTRISGVHYEVECSRPKE